jgi:hypothetical protein
VEATKLEREQELGQVKEPDLVPSQVSEQTGTGTGIGTGAGTGTGGGTGATGLTVENSNRE